MRPLSSSRRIAAVRAARQRAAAPTMVVQALVRDDGDPIPRIAVVANRAVGSAVRRNRAKRRLRAAARSARLPDAVDLVIDARAGTIGAPFGVLHRDLERLTARALDRSRR